MPSVRAFVRTSAPSCNPDRVSIPVIHIRRDKKDGMINDFNNYLRILKNVHAGADLEKCVEVQTPSICSRFQSIAE